MVRANLTRASVVRALVEAYPAGRALRPLLVAVYGTDWRIEHRSFRSQHDALRRALRALRAAGLVQVDEGVWRLTAGCVSKLRRDGMM
jgi:hypothetical protein